MKKLATYGVVIIAGLARTPVLAADMALKAPPPAPPPGFTWSGCYVGINGGWLDGSNEYNLSPSGSYLTAAGTASPPNAAGTGALPGDIARVTHSYSSTQSGGLVGGQAGCNTQFAGSWVFGAETDLQWSSLNSTVNAAYGPIASASPGFTIPAHTENVTDKLEWFSTTRLRLGYAFDRLLVYGTGGFAYGEVKSNTDVSFGTVPVLPVYNGAVHTGSLSQTEPGWAVGGGVEYAFLPNWSFKVEYLYVDLVGDHYSSPLVAATAPAAVGAGYGWNTNINDERINIVRAGINFKY